MSAFQSLNVLLVDDNQHMRTIASAVLQSAGIRNVREASDGFKALGVMQQWEPQILLTDLRMPLMDGITLLRKVREVLDAR